MTIVPTDQGDIDNIHIYYLTPVILATDTIILILIFTLKTRILQTKRKHTILMLSFIPFTHRDSASSSIACHVQT